MCPKHGILSHLHAGTGAILVATREERRFLAALAAELPETVEIGTVAAPAGTMYVAGSPSKVKGLGSAYKWAAETQRALVVYDWHVLANAPGHWRAVIEALPSWRAPAAAGGASLVIFVGPHWDLSQANPLRGQIPVIEFAPPTRRELVEIAEGLHPLNGVGEQVADALVGLTAEVAEQAAAECLAAHKAWVPEHLRDARRSLIREAGLELWPAAEELGGLGGLKAVTEEIIPWIRDETLALRRVLCAGVPGVGKSYAARWIAGQLGCECARLNLSGLKGSLVGQSEAALRRALAAIDALAVDAPLVVVIDEIDTIAREGLDGGTSSGMFAELLTWLQESTSQAVVVATLNHLSKLDVALESRFAARLFFDLPTAAERQAVAEIHYARVGVVDASGAAATLAGCTEGWSSREIAEYAVPTIARRSRREPDAVLTRQVCGDYTPASVTGADQLETMRRAAGSLIRANDPEHARRTTPRRIMD